HVPSEELAVGDVAPRTVEAPFTYRYQDFEERERRQVEARAAVPVVYVHRADLADSLTQRIGDAYTAGRAEWRAVLEAAPEADPTDVPVPQVVGDVFRKALGAHVPDVVLEPLVRAGLPPEAEAL